MKILNLLRCSTTILLLFNLPEFLAQGQPQFVKQVAQVSSVVEMNGNFYFVSGSELWKSDGTTNGTVSIKQFQNVGFAQQMKLIVGGSHMYFFANDGTNGFELWKSDGTTNGTVLLKDINPNGDSFQGAYQVLIWANNTFFFTADNGTNGVELWKSDGTEVGTSMIKDINPGAQGSTPQFGIYHNGELFFDASNGVVSRELFKSDGTEAGTVLVKDISQSVVNPSLPGSFFVYNNELYFIARPFGFGVFCLHKTDGTTLGTNPVSSSVFSQSYAQIVQFNGNMFLRGQTTNNNLELAKSDGTSIGTVLLNEINPNGASIPQRFCVANNLLFFTANDGTNGEELWKTDGSTNSLVKDIFTGSANSNSEFLTSYNNSIFFRSNDGINGDELWKSDGTTNGTSMFVDLNPGAASSSPYNLFVFNDELYFAASDGSQSGLWKLGASSAGVTENSTNFLSIYPNPAANNINIKTSLPTKAIISATDGIILTNLELSGETAIDLSSYAPGVYFIRTSEGQTVKFIKK